MLRLVLQRSWLRGGLLAWWELAAWGLPRVPQVRLGRDMLGAARLVNDDRFSLARHRMFSHNYHLPRAASPVVSTRRYSEYRKTLRCKRELDAEPAKLFLPVATGLGLEMLPTPVRKFL